jgi:hypothetical protein
MMQGNNDDAGEAKGFGQTPGKSRHRMQFDIFGSGHVGALLKMPGNQT